MPIPLTVCTSWAAGGPRGIDGIVERAQAVDAASVELAYDIRERDFRRVVVQLDRAGLPVRSLHNFCPHPASFDRMKPSGHLFRLSSPDDRERELAVGYTLHTVHHAAAIGARVVVLHLRQIEAERLGRALDPVVREADRLGVRLGLEAPAGDLEALEQLLDAFGDAVGLWLDTGREPPSDAERGHRLAPHVIGVHLSPPSAPQRPRSGQRRRTRTLAVPEPLEAALAVASIVSLELTPDWTADDIADALAPLAARGLVPGIPTPA